MRIGLNLLYLVPGETGGRETYARELVPAMIERSPELEFVAIVNRDAGRRLAAELGDRVRGVVLPVSARRRGQWACGEVALVSAAARHARVDVLHSMANFAPAWGRFRRVVTIHDLHYLSVPELLSWPMRAGTSALVSLGARRSDRIIAVSNPGREEIAAGLGVGLDSIDVVPNGVRPPALPADAAGLRERHRLGRRPVALTVASNLPHKNLSTLLGALATIAAGERPVLVLAGHETDSSALKAHVHALAVEDDVRLLGRRSTVELESLYALADCLVLPTLHEGFGLPVLEAMARSLPVACSDIPALREVAGTAALYFDPRAPQQIAASVRKLLTDAPLASRLRTEGLARAKRFSWAAAAQGTIASYQRALAGAQGTGSQS